MIQFKEQNNTLVITKTDGSKITYTLLRGVFNVSERQLMLPFGQKLEYPDGSKFIHSGEFDKHYALIRNWKSDGVTLPERVAIPWQNLRKAI